ncbi:hypothetical protein [Mycolicibacterium sediminis]|uniref:hypothetical protein n=1 Tax=Mycolicibacterium sediminis TaxID=1286180 RepID=UPI0013D33A22|nr:hypothetical protein [Mycolicibacterium sediminis]
MTDDTMTDADTTAKAWLSEDVSPGVVADPVDAPTDGLERTAVQRGVRPAPVVTQARQPVDATVAVVHGSSLDTPSAAADVAAPVPTISTVAHSTVAHSTAGESAAVDRPAPVTDAGTMQVGRVQSTPAPQPGLPTPANVVGTLFFAVFDFFNRLIEGPPTVPAGSNLRAGRSTLPLDCGDGYTADADWYFPTSGQPDKLIYFQHGFGARASFYNLTAAELAERNNAIVVAPSITGNFFACDGCSLDGDQMHAAVAKLFLGDPGTGRRTALAASAAAAGYEGTLPDDFVIAGHSEGGQLAAGSAGYFADYASADRRDDLLGVLLFDTSATGGALERALPKLVGIPVLHIAGEPAALNTFGDANVVLEALRPGQFNGVRLVGGMHSDAFRSTAVFGLAQVIVSLATGFSTPENVEAVQVLAQGWITDWFEGTRTDRFYGEPGSTIPVATAAGVAYAEVLPVAPVQLSFFDQIANGFFGVLESLSSNKPSAVSPEAMLSDYAGGNSSRHSTAITALSLDGRQRTGQSVGQQ